MCRRVPLSQGKFTLVSDEDYERVMQFKWSYDNGYASRNAYTKLPDGTVRRERIMLHRFIMGTPPGMDCDHRNRNKLDNRRCNLRNATRSQNMANSPAAPGKKYSPYKGVFRFRDGNWYSEIRVNGKRRYLGQFPTDVDAARAYDRASLAAWGDFAYLNFPELRPVYALSLALAAATARASSN